MKNAFDVRVSRLGIAKEKINEPKDGSYIHWVEWWQAKVCSSQFVVIEKANF